MLKRKKHKIFLSVVDINYRYVFVSKNYLKEAHVNKNSILGNNLKTVWGKETFENYIKPFIDLALQGESVQNESWFKFRGGKRVRFYEIKYFPMVGVSKNSVAVLTRDLTLERRQEEEIRKDLYKDSLTEVFNRKLFEKDLNYSTKKGYFHLLMLDLDNFKQVNTNFGHLKGDLVIKAVSGFFQKNLGPNQKVYRLGGDEFAILGRRLNSESLKKQAERIIAVLEKSSIKKKYGVGVSIGIVLIKKPKMSVQKILDTADKFMYKVKNTGKNAYSFVEI